MVSSSSAEEHAREVVSILNGNACLTLSLIILVAETTDRTLVGFLEAALRSHPDGCNPALKDARAVDVPLISECGLDNLSAMHSLRFLDSCTRRVVLVAFASITLTTAPAAASRVWNWNYSGSGITARGTFVTLESPKGNGGYLITGITGTRNGKTITGLQAPGTSIPGNEPYTVDNLVFLGLGPQLTSHGFGFAISDGDYSNPFYAGFLPTPEYLEFFSRPPLEHSELPVRFSATPVPEPATYVLVFCALAWATFRCRSRSGRAT